MPQLSSITPGDHILSEAEGVRRAAARRAFWSDHPLNLAFRAERQADGFSLKDFVAFVVATPADQFSMLTGGHDAA